MVVAATTVMVNVKVTATVVATSEGDNGCDDDGGSGGG